MLIYSTIQSIGIEYQLHPDTRDTVIKKGDVSSLPLWAIKSIDEAKQSNNHTNNMSEKAVGVIKMLCAIIKYKED